MSITIWGTNTYATVNVDILKWICLEKNFVLWLKYIEECLDQVLHRAYTNTEPTCTEN